MKINSIQSALLLWVILSLSSISLTAQNWVIGGNANIGANHYLGTSNNVNLRFRTNNVERMVLNTTGNLGIGVVDPLYRLSVANSTLDRTAFFTNTFNSNVASYSVYSENTNTSTGHGYAGHFNTSGIGNGPRYGLRSQATGGNNNFGIYAAATSSGNGNAYAVYGTVNGGGNNYAGYFAGRVYVSTNLGIGNAQPAFPLEFNNTTGDKLCLYNSGGGNFYGFGVDNNTMLIHSSHSGSDIAFGYGNNANFTPNMILKGTGNMGVGTTSPLGKLHVSAGAEDALIVQVSGNSKLRVNANSSVSIGTANDGPVNGLYVNGATGIGTGTPSAKLHVSAGAEDALIVQVSGNSKLRVNSNGSVSVGSASDGPANGLFVSGNVNIGLSTGAAGYKLAVDGKAIMEEVKVQMSGNWPDYVFENEYDLKDISEVKDFIQANGHLPGIPSASDIHADGGIELGEMQRLMMEKIEELTLYIITLEEEMDALKQIVTTEKNSTPQQGN